MTPKERTIAGERSWILRNDVVELALTRRGGHMAPVTFFPDGQKSFQPYWIAPWCGTDVRIPKHSAVLKPARGDFFCMPFGANPQTFRGEAHPLHGEPSVRTWTFGEMTSENGITALTTHMRTKIRQGKVTKTLFLRDGEPVVYSTHELAGFTGPMPVGHHHTLAMPDEHPQSVLVSSSAIRFGMTNPTQHAKEAEGEYQALAVGEKFKSLKAVPTRFKNPLEDDCSAFPTRRGYIDLLQIFHKTSRTPAWITATFTAEGFLWFAIKDPRVLPATLFWMENHGRWNSPWRGQNNCLGLENTCSYFAEGLADSVRPNLLRDEGIDTYLMLSEKQPTYVRVIQGAIRVPQKFGRVRRIEFQPGRAIFHAGNRKAETSLRWEFLADGEL